MFFQLVAGIIYSLSFEPVGLWFLAPVSLALNIYLLRRFRRYELQSFFFAFTSSLIILSWSKTFVGALPWIALAVLQGLLAIPIGMTARFTKSIPAMIFATLAMEEVRARFPFGGFSWTKIAHSQSESPFASYISISGFIGLSLITLLIAQVILERSTKNIALVVILFVGSFFIYNSNDESGVIRVRAIQGGVPQRGLEFNARAQAVLDNHISRTLSEFESGDEVILWPENAIDVDPRKNVLASKKLQELSQEIKRPLIAGAILDDEKLYNSTILYNSDGAIESIYIKRYLTPFGEYIPLRNIASLVSPHVQRVTDFSPGKSLVIHQLPQARVGSVICYELLNDGIVREAALESDFLVVHTNSATFSGSSEGEQQMAITRLRAMESNRSIVSVSTTGPSALVSPRGVVLAQLNDGEVGSLAGDISLHRSQSFSHALGGYSTALVLLFTLIWAVLSRKKPEFEGRWR
jgi:apolipoprotein N-acyltransferase